MDLKITLEYELEKKKKLLHSKKGGGNRVPYTAWHNSLLAGI